MHPFETIILRCFTLFVANVIARAGAGGEGGAGV